MIILSIQFLYLLQILIADPICGNGVLEPGEECDFATPNGQNPCCTTLCKRKPDYFTLCTQPEVLKTQQLSVGKLLTDAAGGGLSDGVCIAGQCVSRSTSCSALNSNVFYVNSSSYEAPFVPCQQDVSCSLTCQGQAVSNGNQSVCLDMGQYAGLNQQTALLPDGLSCGDRAVNSTLGICYQGHCDQALCRRSRCNNRGSCQRSGNGALLCQCDSGFFGARCDQSKDCQGQVDFCGQCNGNNTSCDYELIPQQTPFFATPLFQKILIPVLVGVVAFLFLLLILTCLWKSYKEKREKRKQELENPKSFTSETFLKYHQMQMKKKQKMEQKDTGKFSNPFQSQQQKDKTMSGISVKFDEYTCHTEYVPNMPDELELQHGDVIFKLYEFDDGWAKGYNTRTQEEGVYPVSFTQKSTDKQKRKSVNEENEEEEDLLDTL